MARSFTDEHRKRLSEAAKLRRHTEATKAKIAATMRERHTLATIGAAEVVLNRRAMSLTQ